jgi:hypothetical protein
LLIVTWTRGIWRGAALLAMASTCCGQQTPDATRPLAEIAATFPASAQAWSDPNSDTSFPTVTPSAPAQETPPVSTSAQPQTQPTPSSQTGKDQNNGQGTSKDRLFYALPNFLTLENAEDVPPLTAKEKFKVVTRSAFDPVQFAWYGLLSGISQAEDSEPGYGQGAQGYGKRYGAAFGDGVIEGYMVGAVVPSIFRQDPRYFQSGKGGFWRRTGYAISRIFITRSDSGRSQFNFSEILGSATAAGISTYAYHPHADKTLSNTASVWGTQVSYDTLAYVIKEFWPDIRRKLHKDKSQPTP